MRGLSLPAPIERSARTSLPARALWGILAIWLASLGFRVLYVSVINPDQALTGDGLYYHLLGNRLAEGEGFVSLTGLGGVEEVADHPPGYPVLLGLSSRVGLDSRDEHRLVSALFGSLVVPFIGLAAGRLAGRRRRGPPPAPRLVAWAAISAAVIAAIDVNMWVWDALILAEPLVLAAVGAWLYGMLAYDDEPSLVAALGLGVAFGVAAATRSELLVAVAVLPVLLLRARHLPWRRLAVHGVAMGAGLVLLVGPWVWINLHRFSEPVVMTTGLGTTMVQGNCTAGFYGPYTGYSDFACFDRTRSVVTPGMDASERDVLGREIASDYIGRNLGRLPVVATARVARTFGFFRPVQQSGFIEGVELRGPHWVVWGGLISWQLLLPLGVGGVVLARREGRLIAPVLAVTGAVVVAVALTQGADRYRMALEPLLIAYAGYAVARCLSVVGRSTPALADTGLGRWLRKWSPTPEAPLLGSPTPEEPVSESASSS
ncbi:MAG: hypothetical protein GX471_18100 [Candidatus Microthrix parvicella]|uniref:hypothetical protein n=1 Tax=Candidatus Neomicrothrix sp. TaxID=2719034 RepID=UPI001694B9B1|nr:hypothetical protein [Candidatus Microthrix sp.]NLH68057.1 hypothetical protein [Candidatus Microthrix parvicella]MBL0202817.1 hypothetical protein [Candidatus Microthrix sp.]MBP6136077.1 hypothetical protein [Candidatus Microthrix sp.]MBP6150991.1 hypothetical protein [Candidatus Microthrix sp.]MBP7987684.1 hypothetical protein [Candidatus Microthrix sp.]